MRRIMIGFAVIASELPVHILDRVQDRIHHRGGVPEARFDWLQKPAILPVQWDGSLRLLQWGSRDRRGRLPLGGSLTREQVEAGVVAGLEEGVIPAAMGLHHGVWFLIEEGIRAVVVPGDVPVAYMMLEPSTNYYRNMTGQSPLMPALINQTI